MKAARRSIAFVSGALLYSFGTIAAMEYARVGLPRQVYAPFGGRNALPVMLVEAVVIAALLFIASAIWAYLSLRPTRRRHRPYRAWMMSGIGVAWACWLIFGAFSFALKPRAYSAPLQNLLLSSNAAPLFGALNVFGVLGGAWTAGVLARRKQLSLPSTRAHHRFGKTEPVAEVDSTVSTLEPHTVAPPH